MNKLTDKLTDKLNKEIKEYMKYLLILSKEQIMEKSYETVIKTKIAYYCDFGHIDDEVLNKFLEASNSLDFLYKICLVSGVNIAAGIDFALLRFNAKQKSA